MDYVLHFVVLRAQSNDICEVRSPRKLLLLHKQRTMTPHWRKGLSVPWALKYPETYQWEWVDPCHGWGAPLRISLNATIIGLNNDDECKWDSWPPKVNTKKTYIKRQVSIQYPNQTNDQIQLYFHYLHISFIIRRSWSCRHKTPTTPLDRTCQRSGNPSQFHPRRQKKAPLPVLIKVKQSTTNIGQKMTFADNMTVSSKATTTTNEKSK